LGEFLASLKRVSFDPFTLDVETRQLLRGSAAEPVHLSPKAFELLCVLVESRPRAIAKKELHERLWPSTYVSDATLSSLINELRAALGEKGREARFIRTVHGFGYSFVAVAYEEGAPAARRAACWVVVGGREQLLGEGEHVLGRDTAAVVCLNSSSVSRRHARITIHGETATLEDLGSKNGTFVADQPVTAPTKLSDGDRIRVGTCELTFHSNVAPGSTETLR
jgi:DNA-binding winged helix-turn-helix (wHTH) protein